MPQTTYQPDDPCGCGSRRRFADCHGPIFAAPLVKAIPVAQAIYAKDWGVNAAHYQAQGVYAVLANELAAATEVRRVLDIGCGLGQGLEALAAVMPGPDRLIVGVDENPDCLARAAERLQLPAQAVASPRIKLEKQLSNHFASKPSSAPLKVAGETVLLQVDLMVPGPAFASWLDQAGPFDAVTMWFSGVHKARSMTKVAQQIGAKNDIDLREALEDEVLALAARRLRPGGVLQIVHRNVAGDLEAEREAWAAVVSEVVEGTELEVIKVTAHAYEEPPAGEGMTVTSRHFDTTGRQHFALTTMLRRKLGADD